MKCLNDVEIQHVIMELTRSNFLFHLFLLHKALPYSKDLFLVSARSKFSLENFKLKHRLDWIRKQPSSHSSFLDLLAVR